MLQAKEREGGLLGIGIYSISEAARYAQVPQSTAGRWLRGYVRRQGGAVRRLEAKWSPELPEMEGVQAVGFLDLLELRVVHSLRKKGLSLRTISRAQQAASALFGTAHPFATQQFLHNGRQVFAELGADGEQSTQLIELSERQLAFHAVVRPYLVDVDFGERGAGVTWWALGRGRDVILDGRRNLGKPTSASSGVPTAVLAGAFRATGSVRQVAAWYEVSPPSVRDAVAFHQRVAA